MPWSTTRPGTQAKYRTRQHRLARAALLRAYQPGDPCCLCGLPMWPPTSTLHADHDPLNPEQYRGLAHATCNVRDAALRANAIRRGRRRGVMAQRRWPL